MLPNAHFWNWNVTSVPLPGMFGTIEIFCLVQDLSWHIERHGHFDNNQIERLRQADWRFSFPRETTRVSDSI